VKKWLQRLQPLFVKKLSLPADLILEVPRITVVGQLHVYIENHRGLRTYTDQELTLESTDGMIQITGKEFVIKMMLPEEILLEGIIEDITFLTK